MAQRIHTFMFIMPRPCLSKSLGLTPQRGRLWLMRRNIKGRQKDKELFVPPRKSKHILEPKEGDGPSGPCPLKRFHVRTWSITALWNINLGRLHYGLGPHSDSKKFSPSGDCKLRMKKVQFMRFSFESLELTWTVSPRRNFLSIPWIFSHLSRKEIYWGVLELGSQLSSVNQWIGKTAFGSAWELIFRNSFSSNCNRFNVYRAT